MDLYEYQAKHLFGKHNVPVTAGEVCTTADAAREAARKIGSQVVIKAQVKTGGRGKAGQRQRRALNRSTDVKIRSGFRFLEAGSKRLGDALRVFTEKLRPAIDKLNKGQTP